ncbi:hypothetical protein [Streptomyces maremycinicus]|uniref:hypothetical protein n=1 Tax=Streptomyces maremycinicus TaxID=1679753 RepID=UPI000788830D|nr:hypothetical protein [Streptomyces sp. NBRC 110468]
MQQPDRPEGPEQVDLLSGPVDGERGRAGLRTPWRRRSARGRAVIAATTVAVLALGGTVAYAATSGDGGGRPSAAPSASSSEGPGGRHTHGGMGFRPGEDAAHGEATVKDPDTGDWVVRVWQRGTVAKVADDQVTVRSEDGVWWTWTVGSGTTVSADGSSGSGADALKKGDTVLVVGSRSGDTTTADRVLSGTFERRDSGDRHGDGPGNGPGHGPWNRGDDRRSPGPTRSGAAT